MPKKIAKKAQNDKEVWGTEIPNHPNK